MKNVDFKKIKLPETPGVYFFKEGKKIIYIGKATSLKDRIKSYFDPNLISTRGPLLVDMIYRSNKIDFIKTDSVLEALILEANLIKKHQPKYNTKEKDNKSFNYVVITKEDFPRVLIIRGRNLFNFDQKVSQTIGPFTNSTQLKEALKIIRKIFPYRDRCTPLSNKPCFNRQIGLCPGVCDGTINKKDYLKIINKIKLLLLGKISNLKKNLKREMDLFSKKQEFEKAREVRDQIFSLNHIQDVALIKEDNTKHNLSGHQNDTLPLTNGREEIRGLESELFSGLSYRIEAYDAAHLSGTNNVGVMVVMENGELKKSDYRKFKIQKSKGNDIAALEEILLRRLKHTEWPSPNLIVVDGGLAQLNVAKEIVAEYNRPVHQNGHPSLTKEGERKIISVVAVTKDAKHKAKAIIGAEKVIKKYKKEILLINNEAHRFAIAFHRQRRSVIL
jgi:excinuclease UvrABC nuclease subunit